MQLDWLRRYNLLSFEEIDSTNSEALRIAHSGACGDFIIISSIQTGGRGTKGRFWSSFAGNLHASILLETKFDVKKTLQLSFLVANAVFEAINYFADRQDVKLDMKLKWPNDILINHAKVAGILLESIKLNNKNYVVIGLGVNIEKAPKLDQKAVCLKDLGVMVENPDIFLNVVMGKFEALYKEWQEDDSFVQIRKKWLSRAYNLNQTVIINDGISRISGIFKTIDLDGSMRLKLASGQYCNIVSGDVLIREDA